MRQLSLHAIKTRSEECCGRVWMISGMGEEEMGVQRKSNEGERGSSETAKREQRSQDRSGYQ